MARSASRYGATARRNVVVGFLALLTLGLVIQLVRLQVTTADTLTKRGYDRSLRIQTEDALRGMILDREGEPLAISTPVSTLIVCAKPVSPTAPTARTVPGSITATKKKRGCVTNTRRCGHWRRCLTKTSPAFMTNWRRAPIRSSCIWDGKSRPASPTKHST